MGQLVAQHRLVQAAEHPLMLLQIAGIERHPAALGGLHLRRDHGMGMDLRVIGPRRRLRNTAVDKPCVSGCNRRRHAGSTSSTQPLPDAPTPPRRRHHGPSGTGRRPTTPSTRTATSAPRTSHQTPPPHGPPVHRASDAIDERIAEPCPQNRVRALHRACRSSRLTLPDRPRPAAWPPDQTPGTSPGAPVR